MGLVEILLVTAICVIIISVIYFAAIDNSTTIGMPMGYLEYKLEKLEKRTEELEREILISFIENNIKRKSFKTKHYWNEFLEAKTTKTTDFFSIPYGYINKELLNEVEYVHYKDLDEFVNNFKFYIKQEKDFLETQRQVLDKEIGG